MNGLERDRHMNDEALVILSTGADPEASKSIGAHARVTQIGSNRVLVVAGDPMNLQQISQVPGVTSVVGASDAIPESLGLNEQERLFVKGWQLSKQPKTRRGEGLPWDAPGFDAPASPKK
jgi:hypothetical protein